MLVVVVCTENVRGQNIIATVPPNINGSDNHVDIQNNSGGDWYFYTSPTPSAATMSRMDSSEVAEYPWGDVGNFAADPGNYEQDRIYPDEFLRVYPNSLAAGTLIQVAYATTPVGTQYDFDITVTAGAQVTAINILDGNPTTAASLQWEVSFSAAVSGVTAPNFALANPNGITGLSITSVTPDTAQPSTNWTVTVSTGSGTGLLGLNWAGHQNESPTVASTFTGQQYQFSIAPVISREPASLGVNIGTTTTLSVQASLRDNGAIAYQWYSGTSVNPSAATVITGATNTTYTPPTFGSLGSFQFFCRVYTPSNPNTYTDSSTAIVTVVNPPQITATSANVTIGSGQTATFSVTATGTSLVYQWYNGVAPNTSNPVGEDSSTFTSPASSADSNYWVQVSNPGPTLANSSTYYATVITRLVPASANYKGAVNTAFTNIFGVTALDSANNVIPNVPVTFSAPNGANAGGTFAGYTGAVTVNTGSGGVAAAPVFTADSVAGAYNVTATFSTVQENLPATNFPSFTSSPSVTFVTDLTNNFAVTQTGFAAPTFTESGTLPSGVTFTAGILSGKPPTGSGGNYPFAIVAGSGGVTATQNLTLTILEKTNLVAHPTFNTNGAAWILNASNNLGTTISGDYFYPTDGQSGEDRSAWFGFPLYVGAFQASFVYEDSGGGGADGVGFVVQNDPRGTAALGLDGGALGYVSITPSVALLMNIYSGASGGPGLMLGTNGVGAYIPSGASSGRSYQSTSPVNFASGDPISVNLLYLGGVLQASFTDLVYGYTFETQYAVNIPAMLGTNTAYVGITGSEGGVLSDQLVADFAFTPFPTVAANRTSTNTVVLSWPASVGGYILQSTPQLEGTHWQTYPATIIQTNSQNEVIVPNSAAPAFYRLVLAP